MKLTPLVVTTLIIILGIYDLWAVAFGGVESSVSRFMQEAGFSRPTVVFVVGYICGHWWGYMPPKAKE